MAPIAPDQTVVLSGLAVTGTLTIRGTAKDVTFPATIKLDNGKVDASTEFSINRKDFGLVYKGKPDDLIRDVVRVDA